MEASEFISEEFIWSLDHEELVNVFLFVVEGRVWLNGSLMVTLGMWASETVGKSNGLFAADSSGLQ